MNAVREFFRYLTYPLRLLASLPASIISAPGRFMGITLPTRVALVVALSLLLVSIVYFVLKIYDTRGSGRVEYLRDGLIVVALIVVTAVVARIVVKTWLEKDYSRFPEIDEAWNAGLAALRAQGIDVVDTPIFLVLGAGSKSEADALFRASGLPLNVDGEPFEKGWIHWYATSDAIYLVLTKTCRMGALKGKLVATGDTLDHGSDLIRQTINPEGGIRGTAEAMRLDDRDETPQPESAGSAEQSVRGTMMVTSAASMGSAPSVSISRSVLSLTIDEGAEYSSRLEYVCQRLRRERQPVCPCNGILTLLPFEIIKRGEGEGVEVQRAVKADLEIVRQVLALRCCVIALVTGMETEPGFRELVRRIGPKRAKQQRFGHRFNAWNPPIPDQLQALAAHACKAFEDFTYMLFQEKDGLTQYGNRKLYSLLCCVRSTLRTRLTNTLVAAYGDDTSDPYGTGEALLFAGCYFAATGDTEDRQAFVKGVLVDRLHELHGELDWSGRALQEDRRFHQLAQIGLLADGLVFFAVLGFGIALLKRL